MRDTYLVKNLVGHGAFGWVFRVQHRYLGVQALKVLRPAPSGAVEEILHEARILARLSHPHIVRIFDANILNLPEGQFAYISMEYCSAGTLANLLRYRLRLGTPEALSVASQILEALDTTHSLNPPVLHRDLTPGNLLIAQESPLLIKVGDFGLAREIHPSLGVALAAGVLQYLPPEAEWGYVSVASDLYAVGLILFEMLTGVPPFPMPFTRRSASFSEIRHDVLAARKLPPKPPSYFRTGLPLSVDALVVKALSPEPEHRFANAKAFIAAIRDVQRQL